MNNSSWIGFDLGGTKMLAAILNDKGEILGKAKTKTTTGQGSDVLLNDIYDTIALALQETDTDIKDIKGIGMGVPGPVNKEGVIVSAPNLGLENFALAEAMEEKYKVPVLVENDVNAGTYGEFKHGVAKGYDHIVGVFPGTGVGGAVISDGVLLRGARGCGAELGHMIIQIDGPPCGCGQYGDLESLTSRSAMAKEAAALAATGKAPTIYNKVGTDFRKVKSGVLKKALDNKEPHVKKMIKRRARFLGVGLGNFATIFDPEVFIIGGGVVEKLGKTYIKEVQKSMIEHTMNPYATQIPVLEAELGDNAVFIGAVSLLKDKVGA